MHCRGDYSEVRFIYHELRLRLFTYKDGQLRRYFEVHIGKIVVTQSVFLDMVTIRTTDLRAVPGGYLCTIPATHWSEVEHEVNLCLLHMTSATVALHQKLNGKTLNGLREREVEAEARPSSPVVKKAVATRPTHPPPSVMSPSKASRFKSLVPSSLLSAPARPKSIGRSIAPKPVDISVLPSPAAANAVLPPSPAVAAGNLVRGYMTTGGVSFVLNGRQVNLLSNFLAVQTAFRKSRATGGTWAQWEDSPTISMNFESARPATAATDDNIHSRINILRKMQPFRPSREREPSRAASSRGRTSLPAMEDEMEDAAVEQKLVMVIDAQRIMQVLSLSLSLPHPDLSSSLARCISPRSSWSWIC